MFEKHVKRIILFLAQVSKTRILAAAFLLLGLLTFADYLTGLHYGFSLVYLFMVLILTWFVQLEAGIIFSFLSIISWFSVRFVLLSNHPIVFKDYIILSGEALIRLSFFLVVAYILHMLKKDFEIRSQQNRQLIELNNLKNSFVGMVAHDLRNPLSVIELSSSVLLDTGRENLKPDQLSLVEMIYKKSLYMIKLIEDYLDVTKIEAGYLELNKSYHDYVAFIEEIATIDEVLSSKKNIHITIQKDADIPLFSFDRNKINQVVNNLLFNAIHYSSHDSLVRIILKRKGDTVITEFVDSGPGIHADDMARLFEIYYRSKMRKEKGTGLGLAISKKIIEAHNGDIGFRNNPDAGSTFWFSLPLE
jgi:signal transduction histidine kinase